MIAKLNAIWHKNNNLILYLFFDFTGKAITFITPLLFALVVDNREYGAYSLSLVVVYLFSSFFSQAIQNPYIVLAQEEFRERGKSTRSFTAAVTFMLAGAMLAAVGILFTKPYILAFTTTSESQLVAIYFAFLGVAVKIFFDGLYISLDRKVLYGIFSMTGGGLGLAYFGLNMWLGSVNLTSVLESLFIGNLIGGVMLLPFSDWRRVWPLELNKGAMWELWKQVRWVALGVSAMYLINWGDNLILRGAVGLGEIGVYNFAYQFFKAFILLATSLVYFFLPNVVQKLDDSEFLNKYFTQTRWRVIAMWIGVNLLCGIAITWLIQILYAEEYSRAIPVLWILLIASATLMYRRFYEPIFAAQKRFKFIHLVNVIFVVINLGLDIVLVPVLGIRGAAVATAVAYTSVVVIYEFYFHYKVKATLISQKNEQNS